MMDCSKAQRFVQDFADGCLEDKLARDLQRHLAGCTDCRVAQQRAARLQQLLRVKRHEKPRSEYLDGFLTEFHRRLAQPPRAPWWQSLAEALRPPSLPVFRYGLAPVFGLIVACTMILRGVVNTDMPRENSAGEVATLSAPLLPTDGNWPAPQSTPRKIAAVLPRPSESVPSSAGALLMPAVSRAQRSAARYVLDRISLSQPGYEVASIDF